MTAPPPPPPPESSPHALPISQLKLLDAIAYTKKLAKSHVKLAEDNKVDNMVTRFARDVVQHLPGIGKQDASGRSDSNRRIIHSRNVIERSLIPGVVRREKTFRNQKPAANSTPLVTESDARILTDYLGRTANKKGPRTPVRPVVANGNPPSKARAAPSPQPRPLLWGFPEDDPPFSTKARSASIATTNGENRPIAPLPRAVANRTPSQSQPGSSAGPASSTSASRAPQGRQAHVQSEAARSGQKRPREERDDGGHAQRPAQRPRTGKPLRQRDRRNQNRGNSNAAGEGETQNIGGQKPGFAIATYVTAVAGASPGVQAVLARRTRMGLECTPLETVLIFYAAEIPARQWLPNARSRKCWGRWL
ncbi:hypothetical protein FB451DRAFT_1368632 [Mycena latifolia]|nr:hypothetical protein FB451DRAFT_1368632 [Mycena latifolia]